MDFTSIIEKTIKSMSKTRGPGIAKIYRKYFSFINFTIIYSIGMFFYSLLSNFNWVLAILSLLLWTWSMTVGPFSYMWGFKENPKKEEKSETKEEQKVKE